MLGILDNAITEVLGEIVEIPDGSLAECGDALVGSHCLKFLNGDERWLLCHCSHCIQWQRQLEVRE